MIKLKTILLEQTAKEAYDQYIGLKSEELSLMKKLLGDKEKNLQGLLIMIQRKTGEIKKSSDMDLLDFPADLKAPELKNAFETAANRVKEIREETKELEDIMRKGFGDEYLDKQLRPYYKNQLTSIIEDYTDATIEAMKLMQKRSIELKKSNMADEREKYRAELRQWYDGGQQGKKPEMPITPAQKKLLQQFGNMEVPDISLASVKADPVKGSIFK